jgi:hypothetical protein
VNIFELAAFVGVPAGAAAGFYFVAPFGTGFGVLAGLGGAVVGFYVAPLLVIVPFVPFMIADPEIRRSIFRRHSASTAPTKQKSAECQRNDRNA